MIRPEDISEAQWFDMGIRGETHDGPPVTVIGTGASHFFYLQSHPHPSYAELIEEEGLDLRYVFDSTDEIEEAIREIHGRIGGVVVIDGVSSSPYDFSGSMTSKIPRMLRSNGRRFVLASFGHLSQQQAQSFEHDGYDHVIHGSHNPHEIIKAAAHLAVPGAAGVQLLQAAH